MKEERFKSKSHLEFSISSNVITPEEISKELGIEPSRFFCKGDKVFSKHSSVVGERSNNLWALRSPNIISEKETITPHINFIKSILEIKLDILLKYKKDSRMELTFWIWIETEDAGYGFDLQNEEISFLNSISNRISISFISKESVGR
jgi:hypothetical protein